MRTQNCKEGRECARMGQMSLVGAKSTGEYKNEVRCGTDGHRSHNRCMHDGQWLVTGGNPQNTGEHSDGT